MGTENKYDAPKLHTYIFIENKNNGSPRRVEFVCGTTCLLGSGFLDRYRRDMRGYEVPESLHGLFSALGIEHI